MTDVAGNPEEERMADYYHQPWAQEAVCRYFYGKVGGHFISVLLFYQMLCMFVTTIIPKFVRSLGASVVEMSWIAYFTKTKFISLAQVVPGPV